MLWDSADPDDPAFAADLWISGRCGGSPGILESDVDHVKSCGSPANVRIPASRDLKAEPVDLRRILQS